MNKNGSKTKWGGNGMIQAEHISKSLEVDKKKAPILTDISFSVGKGQIAAIVGKSGCGKSTLLSIMAGLDRPALGKVMLQSQNFYQLDKTGQEHFRNENIGIVFQNYHLIPELTCEENIRMPLVFSRKKITDDRVDVLIKTMGLKKKTKLFPRQLSGGEQQRAAIARALVNQPSILFADEPTGALDTKTGDGIIKFLINCAHRLNMTILLVTHDMDIAGQCDKIISMKDGQICEN